MDHRLIYYYVSNLSKEVMRQTYLQSCFVAPFCHYPPLRRQCVASAKNMWNVQYVELTRPRFRHRSMLLLFGRSTCCNSKKRGPFLIFKPQLRYASFSTCFFCVPCSIAQTHTQTYITHTHIHAFHCILWAARAYSLFRSIRSYPLNTCLLLVPAFISFLFQ